MVEYWATRLQAQSEATLNLLNHNNADSDSDDLDREFAHYCQTLISQDSNVEGWAAELQRYLNDMPEAVDKDMDIVEYWQVCLIT